jgi:hypothetical protein
MASLKHAVSQALGVNIRYNKEYNNLFAALLPDENGITRLQCSAGTDLFLHQALLITQNEDFAQNLVKIYTGNQHTLPGIVIEGNLYGFEMTVRGIGFVEFGRIDDPNQSIIVLDARFALSYGIGGEIDLEAVDPENIPYPEMWDKLVLISQEFGRPRDTNARFSSNDPFAFGGASDTPDGDRSMSVTDEIPFSSSQEYDGPSITSSNSTASSTRPNYRATASSENQISSTYGASQVQSAPEQPEVDLSILSAEDREFFEYYWLEREYFRDIHDLHVPLVNHVLSNPNMSDAEFEEIRRQLNQLKDQGWERALEINLEVQEHRFNEILSTYSLSLRPPSATRLYNVVSMNTQRLDGIRQQARNQ